MTPFNDDGSKLADLKQQIIMKDAILLRSTRHIAKMSLCLLAAGGMLFSGFCCKRERVCMSA